MTDKTITLHNLLIAPFVLLVRFPVLLPFWILWKLGEVAEFVGTWLSDQMPGFK